MPGQLLGPTKCWVLHDVDKLLVIGRVVKRPKPTTFYYFDLSELIKCLLHWKSVRIPIPHRMPKTARRPAVRRSP
ncbi:hypothetical protein GBA52_023317 [Prunus armeniaca]|nr:hypothetical protein GBA52_023317 [Prunus armeniaca]